MTRLLAIAAILLCTSAHAHSASDAYLTLDFEPASDDATVIRGQWDIALRDLHFVTILDDDGDGAITWGEVKRHRAQIGAYAYRNLAATGDGRPCTIEPGRQLVSAHADGAYAALFFRIVCPGSPQRLTLDYRLFFAIDPTHRGIVVFRSRDGAATSLMSPDHARVEFALARSPAARSASH